MEKLDHETRVDYSALYASVATYQILAEAIARCPDATNTIQEICKSCIRRTNANLLKAGGRLIDTTSHPLTEVIDEMLLRQSD